MKITNFYQKKINAAAEYMVLANMNSKSVKKAIAQHYSEIHFWTDLKDRFPEYDVEFSEVEFTDVFMTAINHYREIYK